MASPRMRVQPVEGHRVWASVYDQSPNPLLALEARTVSGILGDLSKRRVVDIACGTGRWMVPMNDAGAEVFGVDACEEMLAQASHKPPLRGRLALGTAEAIPLPQGFADLTLCSFAAGYFPNLSLVMSEIARVTKSGGQVILSDLHPDALQAGWKRSFHFEETSYDIDHLHRPERELSAAGHHAHLEFVAQINAYFGEPELPLFREAGKEEIFAEVSRIAAVWIGVWKKQ